jgi:predicted metal-binding membrane protein
LIAFNVRFEPLFSREEQLGTFRQEGKLMWLRVDNRRVFMALLAALIALCWLALSMWSFSPYAPLLNHEILEEFPLTFNQEYIVLLLVFVTGWTLMTFAMMLPTSLALIAQFQRLTQARSDQRTLIVLLITSYMAVWILFGALAHLGDLVIHEMVIHQIEWLEENAWVISAAIFALAGLYQFSSLKYVCLDKCRSPYSFIVAHWQGRDEKRQSLLLGLHHGLFCLGCCWSLMLLMFAVGVGSVAWMLLLGTIMAVEKNMPWGRQMSAPLGVTLLGFSALLVGGGIL